VTYRGLCNSLKFSRCLIQAKRLSSVHTNMCLLPPSMQFDSRYTRSC